MTPPLLSTLLFAVRVATKFTQPSPPLSLFDDDLYDTIRTHCDLSTQTDTWFCPHLDDQNCFIANERGQIPLVSAPLPPSADLDAVLVDNQRLVIDQLAYGALGTDAIYIQTPDYVAAVLNEVIGATRRGKLNLVDCDTLHTLPTISFAISRSGRPDMIELDPSDYVIRVNGGCFSPFRDAVSESEPADRWVDEDALLEIQLETSNEYEALLEDSDGHEEDDRPPWHIGQIFMRHSELIDQPKETITIIQLNAEQTANCSSWREARETKCQAEWDTMQKEAYSSMLTMKAFGFTDETPPVESAPLISQPDSFFMSLPTRIASRFNERLGAHKAGMHWAIDCDSVIDLPDLTFTYTTGEFDTLRHLRGDEYIIRIAGLCLSPFLDFGTEVPVFEIGDVFLRRYEV